MRFIILLLTLSTSIASANVSISKTYKNSKIIIRTSSDKYAGAINSLTWNGYQYINNADHGRQLQSSSNFSWPDECYNPTEAGTRLDGAGPVSSSVLLAETKTGSNSLYTRSKPAFWLAPGEVNLEGSPTENTTIVSDHTFQKWVTIGHYNMSNVIEYRTIFTVPNEGRPRGTFEILTAYMPPSMSVFYKYDLTNNMVLPLDDTPGEQEYPIIFTRPSGSHAIGIFAPSSRQPFKRVTTYGRWRWYDTTKWNNVYRYIGTPSGSYEFVNFVIIGTFDDVKATMYKLYQQYGL